MKRITIILIGLLISACGGNSNDSLENILSSGDIEQLKEKRSEIMSAKEAIETELASIDEAIAKLDTNKNLPLVTISNVKTQLFEHYIELQGDVTTKQNILIYPEIQGILKEYHVTAGQRVQEGQLIASLSSGGLREQLQVAEIQAELAKTTFEKQERLWKDNIGSEMQYLSAKTNAEASQKTVEQIREQLEKTQIRAPFTGIVDDLIADQGQLLAPGQTPLIRLVNLSNMYIKSDVPETFLSTVSIGNKALVHFPALDTTIESKISLVSNYINPNNRTFTIEVNIPNTNIRIKPNLLAKLRINDYINENAVLVPQSLISENSAGEQYLYKAELLNSGKTAKARKSVIRTGLKEGNLIEVVAGLKPNENVIKEGARTVKDNQEVEIIQ